MPWTEHLIRNAGDEGQAIGLRPVVEQRGGGGACSLDRGWFGSAVIVRALGVHDAEARSRGFVEREIVCAASF